VAKTAIMCNIGYTYFLLEQYDDAYHFLVEAEKLIKEYNIDGSFVHYKIGISLAKVYNRKKVLDKAKEYLRTIVEFEEFKTSLIERIDYYATYAEYEANVGLITEAVEHYKLAITYAEQNNMYIELRTYFKGLILILKQSKCNEEAKIYEEKYNRVIKS
jgi:tetratricopeptide (TPR) repeat protein